MYLLLCFIIYSADFSVSYCSFTGFRRMLFGDSVPVRIIKAVHKLNRYGLRRKLLQHRRLDLTTIRILHLTLGLFLNRISIFKFNAPLKEQFQPGFHRVTACFHHDEVSFGHGFQFVYGHERSLNHLKLTVIAVVSRRTRNRSAEDGLLSEVLGH